MTVASSGERPPEPPSVRPSVRASTPGDRRGASDGDAAPDGDAAADGVADSSPGVPSGWLPSAGVEITGVLTTACTGMMPGSTTGVGAGSLQGLPTAI